MGRVIRIGGAVVAVAVVVVLIVLGSMAYAKDRAAQREDFRADAAAVGFANVNPQWSDEDDGSALEANVLIDGCLVQLEREAGEKQVLKTFNDRKIELWDVDEINIGNREYETDDFNGDVTLISDIEAYLKKHGKQRFPCYAVS